MSTFGRDLVLFSTADWDWPYWTNKQHMAVHLAARGFRVLYVESTGMRRPGFNRTDALRVVNRAWRGLAPIRRVRPNLDVLSPLTVPGAHRSRPVSSFNAWQLRRRILSWRRANERPLIWTYHPYMLDVAKVIEPSALIYHCVDALGAIPGVDGDAFGRAEVELLARADHVFVTSPALREHCEALAPARTHYFANPADIDHFSAARRPGPIPEDLAAVPRPRLGYIGVFSDFKIDLDLIEQAVSARRDWHWVFVGEEREGQRNAVLARLKRQPNVHLLGWCSYYRLPDYLRGIDVALLPARINPYTRAMFPMKFFEYLAAGRPVVATPLPALEEFQHLYRVAGGAEDMVCAVEAVLANPNQLVWPLDHPVLHANSWRQRLVDMLSIVEGKAVAA